MRIKAVSVKPLEEYRIFVSFNDGTEGIYDLSDLAGKGVFTAWDEGDYFKRVFINQENNAIAWDDYLEIDTINCYLNIKGITWEQFKEMTQQNKYAFS